MYFITCKKLSLCITKSTLVKQKKSFIEKEAKSCRKTVAKSQLFSECPPFNKTTNVIVANHTTLHHEKYVSGSALMFSCENQLILSDPAATIVGCSQHGYWNSSFPTCESGWLVVLYFVTCLFDYYKSLFYWKRNIYQ